MPSTIKSFAATYYNSMFIRSLSSVVCPPYDVISQRQLRSLKKRSPYNFSHVLLASDNNYGKIGEKFREWAKKEVLVRDKKDSLYLYEQTFTFGGKKYKRFGVLSLLRLNKKGVIFPHEYTLKEPKKDRSRIIREVKANLSPIFVITPKPLKILNQIYRSYTKCKPFFHFRDYQGNDNFIWKIEDKKDIRRISSEVDKYKLVIADGHHRFEVACDYYRKNKDKFKDLNYILAYITDVQKGLLILPTHRIAKVKDRDPFKKLKEYFYIKEVRMKFLGERLKKSKGVFCLGIYKNNKAYFIRLKNSSILDKIIYNPAYKQLDTHLLHKLILPLIKVEGKIFYTHSMEEAKRMAGKERTAFILRPTPLEIVFKIANKGFRLPQKSTYFYPKVACGIVIRRFEQ